MRISGPGTSVRTSRRMACLIGILTLSAGAFIQWMRKSWGRPRRSWRNGIGPIDAWRHEQ